LHWTLGILAPFQAIFYASAFSQLNGILPPIPTPVTQTVGSYLENNFQEIMATTVLSCGFVLHFT